MRSLALVSKVDNQMCSGALSSRKASTGVYIKNQAYMHKLFLSVPVPPFACPLHPPKWYCYCNHSSTCKQTRLGLLLRIEAPVFDTSHPFR